MNKKRSLMVISKNRILWTINILWKNFYNRYQSLLLIIEHYYNRRVKFYYINRPDICGHEIFGSVNEGHVTFLTE